MAPLGLAGLAPLGLVSKVFVVEEVLFPRREDELRSTIDALEYAIREVWHGPATCCSERGRMPV
jgi:hypothetical protein